MKIWTVSLFEQTVMKASDGQEIDKCEMTACWFPRRSWYNRCPSAQEKILIKVPCSEVVASNVPSVFKANVYKALLCAWIDKVEWHLYFGGPPSFC